MDIVHDRAVGIDISKRDAKVRVRVPGPVHGQFVSTVTTCGVRPRTRFWNCGSSWKGGTSRSW